LWPPLLPRPTRADCGQARKVLSLDHKCLIIKDSSANKCGVVTSSYEVLGGMILDEQQFLSVKEEYVAQVLQRLRHVAAQEAGYLMREWRTGRAPVLPEACVEVSKAILRLSDAVHAKPHDDTLIEWVASLLPLGPLMRGAGFQGLPSQLLKDKLPPAYLTSLVAKVVASECIYREGPEFFAAEDAGAKAIDYVQAVLDVDALANGLQAGGRADVAEVLRLAAPRTLVEHGVRTVAAMPRGAKDFV
jgi:glutamate dehydrogenase